MVINSKLITFIRFLVNLLYLSGLQTHKHNTYFFILDNINNIADNQALYIDFFSFGCISLQ